MTYGEIKRICENSECYACGFCHTEEDADGSVTQINCYFDSMPAYWPLSDEKAKEEFKDGKKEK